MAVASMHGIKNYDSAAEFLGKRETKVLANNTTIYRVSETEIAVRYHYTDIATFHATPVAKHVGGAVRAIVAEFSTGGYDSVTTTGRISQMTPRNWAINKRQHASRLTKIIPTADPYNSTWEEIGAFRDLALTADGDMLIVR